MKTRNKPANRATHADPTPRKPDRQTRTCRLFLLLAAFVTCGPCLLAEVIDDFESAAQTATLWDRWVWNGSGSQTVTNGQVKLEITPPDYQGGFSSLASVRTWTLREGRTVELRVDLLTSNEDGAAAYLGFWVVGGNRCYALVVDRNTVALAKRESPGQMFFFTNGLPIKVTNVKLVLSMTGTSSSVFLKCRILDNDNSGAVVFERECLDTAAADPMDPGWGLDDPPSSYLGLSGSIILSLYRDPGTIERPVALPPGATAEVVYDNAEVSEYDTPSLQIANSVLLSWSQKTEEEQIVVGADSLASDAVWTPWPEPVFKRCGELCMTVPVTASQQYFRLVPGTQFRDDFSEPEEPFPDRNLWEPYFWDSRDATRVSFTVANGAFRILTHAGVADGRAVIAPPGTLPVFRDFTASVDILHFAVGAPVGLCVYARGTIEDRFPGGSNAYLGQVYRNRIAIFDGSTGHPVFFTYDPTAPYRLQFSGVGNHLSLRLVNLKTGATTQQSLTSANFSHGHVTLGLPYKAPGESFDIILDNFFVTGTKP